MRFAQAGLVALTLTVGCVRFGYDAQPSPSMPRTDASDEDAGTAGGKDAAVEDAASHLDGSGIPDAARDADPPEDSGNPRDAGIQEPIDSGPTDSGDDDDDDDDDDPIDAGLTDECAQRPGVLFCDGFEDAALMRWSRNTTVNGMTTRTTARHHGGASSLRATTGAAGTRNQASYGVGIFAQQKSGDIWLRYYYFLPSSTQIDSVFSSGLVGESETPNAGFYLLIRPNGVDISTGNAFYRSTTVFPRERWVCVELHVQIDAAAGSFEAYLDGTRVVRSSMPTDTLPEMGYTNFDVGIHYTDSAQGPLEVFVDDVAAGTVRVGCD